MAICALALLGGGTAVALAATGSHRHARHAHAGPHGALAAAARYLGVSTQQLRQDLSTGKTLAEVADATPGHSEAGLIEAILAARKGRLQTLGAQLPERVAALVKHGRAARGAHPHAVRRAALDYLGLDVSKVRAQLRGGRTLAQIADAIPGKSAAGLTAALLDARRARLDEAVKRGQLTRHAATARAAKLSKQVQAILARRRASSH